MSKLFFSYSHKDEALRNDLEIHLAPLKREGLISAWHDRRITAGSDLGHAISAEIEEARIIVLLVSPYFLASDYCMDREMARALERHAEGTAAVIPVILHPCDWQSSRFGHLLATPTDGKPVSMFANPHEAFAIVARDIRQVATKMAVAAGIVEKPVTAPESGAVVADVSAPRSSNLRIRRRFDDHEKDGFLEDGYEYIARFFEGSLQELERRNPQIKTRFKRLTATSFSASIYESGRRVAQCSVWYGAPLGSPGIAYSHSDEGQRNSFNELLGVTDDGFTLQFKPAGMHWRGDRREATLSAQGAAELYWSLFIAPLQ